MNASCAANLREWTAGLSATEVSRSEIAALVGLVCLTSYLFLFVAFYIATYKGGKSAATSARKAASHLRVKFSEKDNLVRIIPARM